MRFLLWRDAREPRNPPKSPGRKADLLRPFNRIGQSSPPVKNIFIYEYQKLCINSRHPARLEGVSRSSRNVVRGAMAALERSGRGALVRTAKSCGRDSPTLGSTLRAQEAGGTVANKPGTPARARISRNTIARGMPVVSAEPVVTAACVLVAGGPWVRPASGIPRALLFFRAARYWQNPGEMRRGIVEACLVIARSASDEAIHVSACGAMDCFAEPVIGRRFARTRWLAMTM
jgi:hypothetical protein